MGVDLPARAGTPVGASADGRVIYAGGASGYGLMVVIEHAGGLQTRYAHLSRIGVAIGQQVARGNTIGLVGSTGDATGPHLHYEVRVGGVAVDPMRYFAKG